ncbi:MAG TPA: histidine phosphatase family protein [Pedococcus sp.]|jgi:broad specificity phosphatase PhoE|uniref:histidine phosphatase family protein n=1 Tax=Pedococcus sp. TaxID=2860345 RepID=UPI002F944B04
MSDLQCPARVILARHAEAMTPGNGLPRRLTPRGGDQARALAGAARDRRVAALWSSTMDRAAQTAGIVAEQLRLPVTYDDRLRELMADEASAPDPRDADPGDVYASWLDGDLDGAMFGETGHHVVDRLRSVVEEVADRFRGETVLLVSHGGIISLGLIALCRNVDRAWADAHPLEPGEAVELDVDSSGWACRRWADHPLAS